MIHGRREYIYICGKTEFDTEMTGVTNACMFRELIWRCLSISWRPEEWTHFLYFNFVFLCFDLGIGYCKGTFLGWCLKRSQTYTHREEWGGWGQECEERERTSPPNILAKILILCYCLLSNNIIKLLQASSLSSWIEQVLISNLYICWIIYHITDLRQNRQTNIHYGS
jgi:hypothetical protein